MRREMRVPVGYDPRGKPEPGVHVLIVQLGNLGSSDCQLTWQEDGAPEAPMIHYRQYAVKALTFGKAHDKIHCDLCERGHVLRDCDFVEWGAGFVREVLVLLAHRAPLYVLLYPRSCSWPEIVAIDLSNHLVSPSMPPSFVFMPYP